jgi:hypothetical protein
MKLNVAIPMITVALALTACKDKQTQPAFVVEDSHELHAAMIQSYWAEHTDAAIERGASIQPYHFQNASAELNGLGVYEVDVLARGADGGPLALYLGRGGASDELYSARRNALIDALVAAGADAGSIRVHSDLSGGDGMDSNRVRFNAEREAEQTRPVYGAPSSDGAGSSM